MIRTCLTLAACALVLAPMRADARQTSPGAGPVVVLETAKGIIEIETYRFRGHSMSDPGKYRSREELEERKKKDPLMIAKRRLAELGVPEDDVDAIDEAVDKEIEEAVRHADAAEPAKEEVMYRTVHVGATVPEGADR